MQNSMKWGFYTGLALIALSLIFYILNVDPNNRGLQFLSYPILIAGIVFGTKIYRDNALEGFISYGRSVGSGVLISLFASIIIALYTYLFFAFVDPSFVEKILEITEQDMIDRGMSDQDIDMGMEMARKFTTPGMMAVTSIFIYTFMGLIFSLLTSFFLKKNKPMFDNIG